MQSTITTIETPQAGVGGKSAKLGVALLTVPENPSVIFSRVVQRAIGAGLRRASVPVINEHFVFSTVFVTSVFEVAWSQRGAAVECIKQIIAELELLGNAAIAMENADDVWVTHHGIGLGGIGFKEAFLKPEYYERTVAAMKKCQTDGLVTWAAVLEMAKRSNKSEGENPEAP